jgi:hypothetical protein
MFVLLSPWSRWILAKCVLAATGRVPWSLMTFLEDARTAGLLQRSGGTYRFRNRRLQDHLAGRRAPDAGAAAEPTAPRVPTLADSRHSAVERTAEHYRLRARSRRLPLAHWAVLGPVMGVTAVRMTVSGQWQEAQGWTALLFWPVLGVVLTTVGLLLPPRPLELELTRDGVTSVIGRRRYSYEWRHIEVVTVRRAVVRGRDARFYALQVRLLPGAPRPPRRSRLGEGWYYVLPVGFTSRVDPQLDAALAEFAGPRWRPSPGDR